MSLFEKAVIGASMVGVTGVGIYFLARNAVIGSKDKNDNYKKRLELLEKDDVKMLYSTMSFLYLQGYKKKDLDSFFTLYEILQMSKPNLVAIPCSEKEYKEKYANILHTKKFEEDMKRAEYFAKIKSDEITTLKDLNLEELDNLYPLYFCNKNSCKIIHADKPEEEYQRMVDAKLKLKELYQENKIQNLNLGVVENVTKEELNKPKEQIEREIFIDRREDNYVDAIIQHVNPKFSIIPQSMYKTIVAVTAPEHLKGIAKRWKTKFKTSYNHEVLEDEESEKKG